MDIKLPTNLQNPSAVNRLLDNALDLKPGQKLDTKVISSLFRAGSNTIMLKLAGNTITVQSNQLIKLMPGQDLQIQVVKTVPVLEFAVMDSLPELKGQIKAADLRLKQVISSTNKPAAASIGDLSLPLKQPLAAKIIAITDSKIQLQLFAGMDLTTLPKQQKPAESGSNKQPLIISIDRSQLLLPKTTATSRSSPFSPDILATRANPAFEVGQQVLLEIHSKGAAPQFKITVTLSTAAEEVAKLMKLFLPRHESAPVLLNQLMKDLPQLLKNNNVPEMLKRIAAEILQNLPQRQQFTEGSALKQAIVNSGLFLEAKLHAFKENPELPLDQDFKANLLKFVEVLKNEITKLEKTEAQEIDHFMFKNLQQKAENNIAKIALDQLTSLAKEDSPKQTWTIDIPFVDRGQAETASLKIACNKENTQSSDNDKWSVTITLSPPGLGMIQCHLTYHNETVNTYFRSQHSQTADLIGHHLDYLKQQLENSGLKTGFINIQNGLQPTKSVYQVAKTTLFDEKA